MGVIPGYLRAYWSFPNDSSSVSPYDDQGKPHPAYIEGMTKTFQYVYVVGTALVCLYHEPLSVFEFPSQHSFL